MAGARLEQIIKTAVERGASDLHIKAGDVFRARIDGRLVPLTKQRLTPDQTRAIAARLVGSDEVREQLDNLRDYDCSWGLPGVGRFRINILRQRSSFMIVMRVIPFALPTLEGLGLPDVVQRLSGSDRGLVLVAGVSGSGKSSTVAAMVHHINQNEQRHIVIIEDPIEFLHRDLNSSITQREVGVDTGSTEVGLRAALRQDPDVVVLGDLNDPACVDLAVKAAETGRLVIAVIPTPDVVSTVAQVLAMLSGEERELGRIRLASALRGIVVQQLVARVDGGRTVLVEVLLATPEVREVIQDSARSPTELFPLLTEGQEGMISFARAARVAQASGLIADETARTVEGVRARGKGKGRRD
ncbi:MAG: PilT/PilU family type 4a pilus ATPase [Gemmatimonadota bacterium]